MLRLKHWTGSINPVNIDSVVINGKKVIISRTSEGGFIDIELETVEDAISFAAYVELLVDISNMGSAEIRNEMVQTFESYFEHKDILRPDIRYPEHERLKKLLTEQSHKS